MWEGHRGVCAWGYYLHIILRSRNVSDPVLGTVEEIASCSAKSVSKSVVHVLMRSCWNSDTGRKVVKKARKDSKEEGRRKLIMEVVLWRSRRKVAVNEDLNPGSSELSSCMKVVGYSDGSQTIRLLLATSLKCLWLNGSPLMVHPCREMTFLAAMQLC